MTNYISLSISLGIMFGVAISSGSGNPALGISVGMMFGVTFGLCMKKKHGKQEK